jgi:NADH-quinone oxidoreductase subunit G
MELGLAGRGEHAEIMAFVGRGVDSELSGNMIDLCPVGALTSRPFRYTARTWELSRRKSVSPHDALGSNLILQVSRDRVMRALPLENEALNECWLSDRDRFSYEGLNSPERLTAPMVKREGVWTQTDWPTALEYAARELARVREAHGADALGALAAPHSTLEELHLLGKLLRGLGSGNIDFRLRQTDFSADRVRGGAPWLGMQVSELNGLDRILLIGSTVRSEHPLLAHRLRQAVKTGAQLSIVHCADDDLLCRVHGKRIVAPSALPLALSQIAAAAAGLKSAPAPAALSAVAGDEEATRIAESLLSGKRVAILLGNFAAQHPARAQLHAAAALIAETCGARVGFLGEAANALGGYLMHARPAPDAPGRHATGMLSEPRKAYLLLHAEAEADFADPRQARAALSAAECVVALTPYRHGMDYAQVLLPIAPFSETPGSFVNTEGRLQRFQAVVRPLGEARPAWKVLRVLGNLLDVSGFDFDTIEQVRSEVDLAIGDLASRLDNRSAVELVPPHNPSTGLERIAEVPIYHGDGIVRRAAALQRTREAHAAPIAWVHGSLIERLGLTSADLLRVVQDGGEAVVAYGRDDRLPPNCVRLATACRETSELGAACGAVTLERALVANKVSA